MTAGSQELLDPEAAVDAPSCSFCLRRLGEEFYFSCRECRRHYCYIHMTRHNPGTCKRRRARRLEPPITVRTGL